LENSLAIPEKEHSAPEITLLGVYLRVKKNSPGKNLCPNALSNAIHSSPIKYKYPKHPLLISEEIKGGRSTFADWTVIWQSTGMKH
jgi:hypothetical protein